MRQRPRLGVILTAVAVAICPWLADAQSGAELVGRFVLAGDAPRFGGFSGLEVSDDGMAFTALSDSAAVIIGTLRRDNNGAITAVEISGPPRPLLDAEGRPLIDPFDDSEGLAAAPNGDLFVSFELEHRVMRFPANGGPAETLPISGGFAEFWDNSGLEGIAIAQDGSLYALPEGDAAGVSAVPVFRFQGGAWDQVFEISEQSSWRPVGADFGPDGRLYVLERDYWGLLGLMSRLRRFSFDDHGGLNEEVLFSSRAGELGNLEGLAIWKDASGALRATMISDTNFLPILNTELVDFRLKD